MFESMGYLQYFVLYLIGDNSITDFSVLSNMNELEDLSILSWEITYISVLGNLTENFIALHKKTLLEMFANSLSILLSRKSIVFLFIKIFRVLFMVGCWFYIYYLRMYFQHRYLVYLTYHFLMIYYL
jgi:hypothetical protein